MTNSNALSTPAAKSGRAKSVSASETPIKQNMSSTNVFLNGNLEEQRKAVRDDLGPIPEVTVDFMLKHIIPNSNVDVKATMGVLGRKQIWSEETGWKQFEGCSPKELATKAKAANQKALETMIFGRMKKIYASIISATQFVDPKVREPTLYFDQFPNSTPTSDTNVKTRPDCYGILTTNQTIHSSHEKNKSKTSKSDGDYGKPKSRDSKPGLPDWFDIAYVEEYKINDGIEDLNDDVVKILWSLHHIMHVDHRRRFTFGSTVENENVRIWFACRQVVLVSQVFNFRIDAKKLVQLIASLAFATPVQLGYDPTMTLRRRQNEWHYDIELTTKQANGADYKVLYKTSKVLSDTAHNLRGRATRVYEAKAEDDPNDPFKDLPVVLKDSWVDADRPKEGDTLTQLLEGASEDEKDLFLTIFQHGIVQIDKEDDSTQGLILKGQVIEIPPDEKDFTRHMKVSRLARVLGLISETPEAIPQPEKVSPNAFSIFHLHTRPGNAPKAKSSTSKSSAGAVRSGSMPKKSRNSDSLPHHTYHKLDKPIVYSPKVHYRIVFREQGESLMQIAGSGRATTRILERVLCDITKALQYMTKKGYVHRDVSAGNIILCGNRAKLSDLEFAKKYGAGASSYVRTGTYSFMAGEVMKGKYSVLKYATRNAGVPFVHNPIHDLESLWWVGVWCLFWHYPAPFTKIENPPNHNSEATGSRLAVYNYRPLNEDELQHVKLIRKNGELLFPSYNDWTDNTRMEEIHDDRRFLARGNDQYADAADGMVVRLECMRRCISWAYIKTQSNLPRDESSYFADILRVANPLNIAADTDGGEDTEEEIQNDVKIPVHERILQVFDTIRANKDIHLEDAILWPLDSIEDYAKWVEQRELLETRPRRHLVQGYVNLDSDANYHDY